MLTKKVKNVLSPALIVIQYLIFMGCCLAYEKQQGLLIRLPEITALNIGKRALHDSISLFPVIVLLIITLFKDKTLNNLGITLKRPLLIIALFSIYLIMFFLNGDFSMKGYYSAFFYLIIVAFPEELIFRGYLFSKIEEETGFWIAAIISGVLFGAAHSLVPAILYDFTLRQLIRSILSNLLGQGILISGVFALLYKKSHTLFVPVLIHAVLDYSSILFIK
ncbi:CPBP family intramembrane glutamic endopeptidase [Caproiciproducens sp. CPB-2]|uniref:CPBP family intramembrane glutamic endopeptidase n=1 Tax=Caproiciproducens sp. CPB-2 TaxID=3030017 RepID=UPI0023D9DF9C|nr:CPBP family intramembrane glutamic endopeptidase [Caproiciproducens sp. CPB-2]MDF1494129.1 CPBP family intramembrane metalloprotease [Caproiciproducens sp. CPB-2]